MAYVTIKVKIEYDDSDPTEFDSYSYTYFVGILPDLISQIQDRNGDVLNIVDTSHDHVKSFEITLSEELNSSPLAQVTAGEWQNFDQVGKGLYALLDRIFWIPPVGPRITGYYDIVDAELTTPDGVDLTFGAPFTSGRGGGHP